MEIRVLGPIELVGDDGPVQLAAPMQRRLLAALVVGAGTTQSPHRLIDALWGEAPPASAAKLLQVYVSQLRKALPSPASIETRSAGYALELDNEVIDAARFERLLEEGTAARGAGNPRLAVSLVGKALDLWRGSAYADFVYEPFVREEAERLEELRRVATEERIEAGLALGSHEELLAEVSSLASAHPLRERLQAQAMVTLYRCGRQSEALELYAALRARLRDELGLEPAPELRELQRRILRHDPSLGVPPRRDEVLARLPASPNALLGRERELSELRTLLVRQDVRLLVLTGAGGSGKTRLALEAARTVASSFANGATFVSVAALREPELLVGEIARALGVQESAGEEPLQTLANALEPREFLLVVDNVEHLRDGTAAFVELIRRAPRLTLLVTSRVVLHLSGEHVYPVEPLDAESAAALFVERACEADPHFSPDEADDEAIRQICLRLDGLPLAIELGASRTNVLDPAELLARLEPRLPLLAGGPRDLPARQQTLRATLDWTVGLLEEEQIHDLTRLAVFTGGCTLEAAEAVCGTTVERLSLLVDHSLLRRTSTASGSRYSMLETVREYALERLAAAGDAEAVRRAHALFFLAFAEQLTAELERGEQAAIHRIETELDNLRTAFAWAQGADANVAVRLAAAVRASWHRRHQFLEGREWLTFAVDRPESPSAEVAAAAAELGRLHYFLGERAAAAERIDQALELAEARDLPDVLASALNTQQLLLVNAGRYEEAVDVLERALVIAREQNLDATLLRTLNNLSFQLTTMDRQLEAKRNDLEGLELARRCNDPAFERNFLFNLVWGHMLLGEWDAACQLAEAGQARPIPEPYALLGPLPWLFVQRGELGEAQRILDTLAPVADMQGFQSRSVLSIARAVVLRAEGRAGEALRSAEEVIARRDALGGRHGYVKLGFVEAVEAAFALDDLDRVAELVGEWDLHPSERTPFVDAHCKLFGARLAARRGEREAVEPALLLATEIFRQLSRPFYVAVALLEHAEWLAGKGCVDDARRLLTEARKIFERLGARPWLDRAQSSAHAPVP